MDRRSEKVLESGPEDIRCEMAETRAALTDKLERLEGRVSDTIEDVQHRVEATVDMAKETVHDTVENIRSTVERAKDSVHDTVEKVKATFDLRQQVNEHPWAMLGGAVAVGFIVGRHLGGSDELRTMRGFRRDPYLESDGSVATNGGYRQPVSADSGVAGHAKEFMNMASSQLTQKIDSLEHAAISAAGSFVERLIKQAVPGLGPFLR